MTTLIVRWATGLLRLIQGRLEEALAGLAEAQRLSSLMGKEVRTIEPQGVMLQTQVRMGRAAEASAALAELDEDERDRALVRIAAAEIHLAQDDPEAALEVLAPVIEGSARAAHSTTSLIDALLFVALARDRLGDARATEEAIERALDLAEREGISFRLRSRRSRELLERHPRHRTAHAALLSEILDVLSGASRNGARHGGASARGAERGRAAGGQIPAEQPEGAGDRGRALRLAEHGADAPAPHLREARRAQPRRGGRARARARPAGAVAAGLGRAFVVDQLSSSSSSTRSPFVLLFRFSTISSAIGTLNCRSPFSLSSPPVIRAYATSVNRSAASCRERRSLFRALDSRMASSLRRDVGERHHSIRMIRGRSRRRRKSLTLGDARSPRRPETAAYQ